MTRSSSFQAVLLTSVAFGALCAGAGTAQAQLKQTNLVSDISGLATLTDSNLVNTWGVSAMPGASPFWISNQGTSTSSLFTVTGSTGVAPASLPFGTNFVNIPPAPGMGGPTGQVANVPRAPMPATPPFEIGATGPSLFIFANLNGTISAWNLAAGNTATVVATTPGAVYTGLAINSPSNPTPMLYAANGTTGKIDVFDGTFTNEMSSGFVDPNLPAGLVPFNVEDIGGKVYVAYAPAGHDAQTGAMAGQGAVAVFAENGDFMQQLVAGGPLASPWGMAIAPANFGQFSGDLLVGNFSFVDSEINAFDSTTGAFVATIHVDPGKGNTAGGLWDLMFGTGGPNGDPRTLFFTDGINGETDGLFGALTVPEPSTWAMMLIGFGGLALFAARRRAASAIV
jgi:uncharacterized protein (TIGR03118 family)